MATGDAWNPLQTSGQISMSDLWGAADLGGGDMSMNNVRLRRALYNQGVAGSGAINSTASTEQAMSGYYGATMNNIRVTQGIASSRYYGVFSSTGNAFNEGDNDNDDVSGLTYSGTQVKRDIGYYKDTGASNEFWIWLERTGNLGLASAAITGVVVQVTGSSGNRGIILLEANASGESHSSTSSWWNWSTTAQNNVESGAASDLQSLWDGSGDVLMSIYKA